MLAASLFFILAPATKAGETQRWSGLSVITFKGTSTLHDWSGKVATEPFVTFVTFNDDGKPSALKAEVQVKAAKMDTSEPKRDEKMREAMRVVEFPLIKGTMDTAFTGVLENGTPAKLPFKLNLLDKTHEVEATISNWRLTGDTATFDLDFDLSMKKCGISVPSVLLVIRVGDTVKVSAEVKLTRKNA